MAYTTCYTLLNGVADNDDASWRRFQEFYQPLITICGHDYGLNQSELEELQQDVLLAVFKENVVQNFVPGMGRFRDYLRVVIHRKAFAICSRRPKKNNAPVAPEIPVEPSQWSHWEDEWQAFMFSLALAKLKEQLDVSQYMAFEMYALKNMSPKDVAKILGISVESVYQTKTRLLVKLREIVTELKKSENS